jgi:hypothetical protein
MMMTTMNSCTVQNVLATDLAKAATIRHSAGLRRLLATYTPALLGMQSTVWGDSPHAA